MGYSLQWLDTNIIVRFDGTLSFKDIYNANKKIYGDIRFAEMDFQMIDYRSIVASNLTKDEITAIGNLEMSASMLNNSLKLAVVSTEPEHLVCSSQIYIDSLAETDWKFQMFDDIDQAMKWCRRED